MLEQQYRTFAAGSAAASPLSAGVALAFAGSDQALGVLGSLPARRRHPRAVLAALHDLALAGRAPALATAYLVGDAEAAARAALEALLGLTEEVLAIVGRRPVRDDVTGHATVLHPAVAEVAHRVGAAAVGLIDVGGAAGLNLFVDRVGLSYSNGQVRGDPASPLQLSASVVGPRPLPTWTLPPVSIRIGLDRDPFDVTDPGDVRWLRACLPPDQRARRSRLDAELTLAATDPPLLRRGDPVELLPGAVARVPAAALPVVLTTWALSRLPPARRARFLEALQEAAAGRTVAWVSVEGVGVAPGVPTLGDRPASGHSTIGVTLVDGPDRQVETVGRCWSRGALLAWLV